MTERLDLIDRIYEAAVLPELWVEVCDALCAELDVQSAAVLTVNPDLDVTYACNTSMQEIFARYSESDVRFGNVRPQRALEKAPGTFLRDTDIMTALELAEDPIYRQFIYPSGLKWAVGCAIREPSGHSIVFDLMRSDKTSGFSDADLARLNLLKPDMARAALLSSRLSFRKAQSITSSLALIGLPAAVISDNRSVMAANADMEAIGSGLRIGAGDRIRLSTEGAQHLLDEGLERLALGTTGQVQSIAVLTEEQTPLVLHLVPVRRQARDVFDRSLAILIVTPVGPGGPPDLRVLSGLFDLTPGESRVARQIAAGMSYEASAKALGLTVETVRTYVKRVMSKTGTSRHAELAVLLSGVGSIAIAV
ncbi:helix-turn-helix transcriptional regulator [Rhizobium alvei]|uniref:Helix-turn-helix transcriptional regulator n=1 Tax=Rhizobium alvei TaxID=1132659 RepID=A0ABT8YH69_9HYPH|nr:helix-turn-helix transcriptional regulator [Rhizobium alvei]MDO6963018.1 helix-turn-helix transcriptional regulator [Rhizobium alvei]